LRRGGQGERHHRGGGDERAHETTTELHHGNSCTL
jgi:hypothetical protein